MKDRLDAFSDAIIAIIITVMVLELPIEKIGGSVDYLVLFRAIGIYAVSFCFVGNLWYQHAQVFNDTERVANKTVVMDLIFLFFMSLVPTFTKLMTDDTSKITVMLYGTLSLILLVVFRIIVSQIAEVKYSKHSKQHEVFNYIFARNFNYSIAAYVILIVLAFFFPRIALVLFIIIPIWSFVENSHEHGTLSLATRGMEEGRIQVPESVKNLSPDQKKALRAKLASTIKASRGAKDESQKREIWSQFAEWAADQR
ncbi:TMEM175 family protein [Fructilactobacillus fructivorans]|nr:TMEM175 family protein [Fructilactobacillus fructivorans]